MRFKATRWLLAAGSISASALAEPVVYTRLDDINGNYGTGVATTMSNANGKTITVVGPAGAANRATGAPNGSWYQSGAGGGATVGITDTYTLGSGSAYFQTTSGASQGFLHYDFVKPIALSALTEYGFTFFRDAKSTTGANVAPVLRLDMLKNGVAAGSLVFEWFYNTSAPVPIDGWAQISDDQTFGDFWATDAALGPPLVNFC